MSSLHIPESGLHIERQSLPQIKSEDVPSFLTWLRRVKKVKVTKGDVYVNSLRPSQGEFNTAKINQFMKSKRDQLKKPIIISMDRYVLDGHHRWLALLNMDNKDTIPAIIVNLKILDLLAVAKEYPKSFRKSVVESFQDLINTHEVITFGRMNPPTRGHQKLINKVHEVSAIYDATHRVILSHNQDPINNPLPQEEKLRFASLLFPETNLVGATKEFPSIIHHASLSYKAGVTNLHVVVGSDRFEEFRALLNKYNGKFLPEGHGYHFRTITIHSAGNRSEDMDGVSSSGLRVCVREGDFQSFFNGLPTTTTPELAREIYLSMKEHMGILAEEYTRMISEGVHDAGIFKAVFLAGGTGSGKDFVLKKSLDGHGLVEINSDKALEFLMDKEKLDKKMPEHEKERRDEIRNRAKSITDLRQRFALEGRNGLIINSTGASLEKIRKIKEKLDGLGYESKMVFVNTSDEVSRERNIERGKRGGRMVPEKLRAEKWKEAQDARVEFSKLFGYEHYTEFDNSADLRTNTDPNVHETKSKELLDIFKNIKKFTETPPKHPQAKEWIDRSLGSLPRKEKKHTEPVRSMADSKATDQAKRLGLEYYGFGRYGKKGTVTHLSVNGNLIEKKKTPTLSPKHLNEEFMSIIQEVDRGVESGEEGGAILGPTVGSPESWNSEIGGASSHLGKKTFKDFRLRKRHGN